MLNNFGHYNSVKLGVRGNFLEGPECRETFGSAMTESMGLYNRDLSPQASEECGGVSLARSKIQNL